MLLHHKLEPIDIIFVLGSRDDRVATHAAELYGQGTAGKVIISGGVSHKNDVLKTSWGGTTEAAHFASLLIQHGIVKTNILLEKKARNTGENIILGHKMLQRKRIMPRKIVLLQKPYMECRTYATFMKQWPTMPIPHIIVSSPPLTIEKYFSDDQPANEVINIMVGDLQRIIEYPK